VCVWTVAIQKGVVGAYRNFSLDRSWSFGGQLTVEADGHTTRVPARVRVLLTVAVSAWGREGCWGGEEEGGMEVGMLAGQGWMNAWQESGDHYVGTHTPPHSTANDSKRCAVR
jgi:hypothetical protein